MKRGLLAVLAVLLAACQTLTPRTPPVGSWETRRAVLQQRDHFDLKGRIAVAAGQEGFNAHLRWAQNGTLSQLALEGPLGVGGAQVEFDGSALTVVTARGQHLSNEAAHAELETRLGFQPPLESLKFWVQGVPDPAAPADEVLDREQRLASLRQAGWEITYDSYQNVGGQWLPEKLTLRREGIRVRVLVDSWSS